MHGLPFGELLRSDCTRGSVGSMRGGVILGGVVVGVHGWPSGQLLLIGGSRGGVGRVLGGHPRCVS